MSIDGQGDRVISASGMPYDWSPDGRFLLYSGEINGKTFVMVMEMRTGRSWPIEQAMDGDDLEWDDAPWAPNGSFIVLYRDGWHDEFLAFDGVTYDAIVKQLPASK